MVTFKEFFSFKNNRFFWLNLVAMIIVVIAIALGTLQWLDNYTRHGEAVVVPNVKGLPMRQDENEIYNKVSKRSPSTPVMSRGCRPVPYWNRIPPEVQK